MKSYAIVEAPSMLGTSPRFGGVRRAPEVLLAAGLAEAIGARRAGRVEPPAYVPGRDPQTQVTNARGLREYALRLADAVGGVLARGEFPVVLGGDCSILLGTLLAAARRGRHGVAFLDGHIDFYPPENNEWDGVGAASELAFAAGRGPTALTDFGIGRPLVRDDDIAAVGFRDQANQAKYGRSLPASALAIPRDEVRRIGAFPAAARAVEHLTRPGGPDGYFIHLDADVIDGKLMPAVDDPSPDGFDWEEAVTLLRALAQHDRVVGMQVTIYNPDADPAGSAGRALAAALAKALKATAGANVETTGAEKGMAEATVLWRRLDSPGHEAARLLPVSGGWHLAGTALFGHDGRPCRLDYLVVCDSTWRTVSGRVTGWLGTTPVEIDVLADVGRWRLNGADCPAVAGCIDLDLNFSPSTNLLPIRRLGLAVGAEARVRAAWLRFPSFALEPLDQVYRRTGEDTYRYESGGGRFVADLRVNPAGFVTHYPGGWEAEPLG